MQSHEIYFQRNRGEWKWKVFFRITNWKIFFNSPLKFTNKLRALLLIFGQTLFGPYKAFTNLNYIPGKTSFRHRIEIYRWRMPLHKSDKQFSLEKSGHEIKLTGLEYNWPNLKTPVYFDVLTGYVEPCTTKANYKMPLLGQTCDCKTILNDKDAKITFNTTWLEGEFIMLPEYHQVLKSRFNEALPFDQFPAH
ncbi:MAG: hypothetical protein V4736_03275 [Bdellovibrionota bacterium]